MRHINFSPLVVSIVVLSARGAFIVIVLKLCRPGLPESPEAGPGRRDREGYLDSVAEDVTQIFIELLFPAFFR